VSFKAFKGGVGVKGKVCLYSDGITTELKSEGFENFEVIQTEALEQAIDLLARNKIVAVQQGRPGMGTRALGNRSLLRPRWTSPLNTRNRP
jgi:predicted NodU family carbamoyl transferase